MPSAFDLYLVVSGGELELERALRAVSAAPSGRLAVQARWKDEPDAVVRARTARLLEAAAPARVPVLVSGRADLARAAGASGVHLPERARPVADARAALGLEGALVGASCHDARGVEARAAEGADFVVLGPVGHVPGKSPAIDDATFRRSALGTSLPVFALGGVRDARDVARVRALGARGVAVQRAICAASDPARALWELLAALDAAPSLRVARSFVG